MARWDVYNIIGDADPLFDYEVKSRDWGWNDFENPTPDVGLAFSTIVRALSEEEQEWTEELFAMLADNGGGRIIKYEGSSIDASVVCRDLSVNPDATVEESEVWPGRLISVYRVDKDTIYNRDQHDWSGVDDELTVESIPYSTRSDDSRDPNPRFNPPLLKLVEEETEIQTAYQGHLGSDWMTAGELPDCLYEIEEIPDSIEKS